MVKRIIATVICLVSIALFALPSNAIAGNAADGKQVFAANCNACHLGGKNVVNAAKTLKKTDLEKYSMLSEEAIITQITKGKPPMPSFKGRLTPQQIEDVAAYVLAQAEAGW